MNKSGLIKSLAKRMNENHRYMMHEKDVDKSVNHIVNRMIETLCKGARIEIRGFGSFSLHYHPPRHAHNPKTGERIITEAKCTPHFKPGKTLREKVNDNRHLPIKTEKDSAE